MFFLRNASSIDLNYCIDIYGTKQLNLFDNHYWLTSKLTKSSIRSFDLSLIPFEHNVFSDLKGEELHKVKKEDIVSEVVPETTKKIMMSTNGVAYINGYKNGYLDGEKHIRTTKSYKMGRFLRDLIKRS